jgi:hypothetical protein
VSKPLKFKEEYRIYRKHGFRRIRAAWRAWRNVQFSKTMVDNNA